MYGIARELYVNGQHARAQRSFELLCLYDHENARYWRALGACRELSKDYLGAAAALTFAAAHTARPDRSLRLSLAECLMAAGQLDAAERHLDELLSAPRRRCRERRVAGPGEVPAIPAFTAPAGRMTGGPARTA